MTHIKKISLMILIGILVFYIGNSLSKRTHSISEYVIEFNTDINVDKDNNFIKYLKAGTLVSNLLDNINVSGSDTSIEVYSTDNILKNDNSLLASGDNLIIKSNNEIKEKYVISVKGDSNGDGIIDLVDLVQIRKHIVKWINPKTNEPQIKSGIYFYSLDFNEDGIIDLIDLVRMLKIVVGTYVYETSQLSYSLSPTTGKWIFINNPEMLLENHLTDNSGKALYSDFINGEAEIYFEHGTQPDEENKSKSIADKANYAIRFYNPQSTQTTLKINACGTTIVRGVGQRYIDTWEEYYNFKECSLKGTTYTIEPYQSQYIYLNTYSTGTAWADYDSDFSIEVPTTKIPEAVIDGVLKVTSSNKLHVESFVFTNPGTMPNSSYDHSDNYTDTDRNKVVYSGYYTSLPNLEGKVTFEFYDNTEVGPLSVKYDTENTAERDIWYTHNNGDYVPCKDCYVKDSIKPIMSNNEALNWGNWAIHYTENITLVNSGTKNRTIAYYIQAYYGGPYVSAIVAFPKDQTLNYTYKREGIGSFHDTNEFLKVWEITVPAKSTITVPTEVLLGGNSSGTLGHKVELVK